VRAFARVLRAPLDPAAHATCADSFAARGADLLEALELRLALRLGPDSPEFRYRLGGVLARHGQLALARRELERAVALGGPREVAERARAALAQLPPGEAGEDER
jgi:Flp pilus assembly protein TadD